VWRLLFEARLEQERRGLGEPAETDIGDPDAAVELDPQKHVPAWRDRIVWLAPQHAGTEAGNGEPDGAERLHDQQVLLEAVAAAPALDDFAVQGFDVELDRTSEERVEVLEGDGRRMQAMQRTQHLECRRDRSAIADAVEIGGEIEVRHWSSGMTDAFSRKAGTPQRR